MSELKLQISEATKDAMRARDKARVAALCDLYRLLEESGVGDDQSAWLPPWSVGRAGGGGAASVRRLRECVRLCAVHGPGTKPGAQLLKLCPTLAEHRDALRTGTLVGGAAGRARLTGRAR